MGNAEEFLWHCCSLLRYLASFKSIHIRCFRLHECQVLNGKIRQRCMHSDLNDQNMFNSTIDAPSGVPEVSKNPNHQTVVHSGELEHYDSANIEETVKNHQNWTKIVKGTLFSESVWNFILFNLGQILALQLTKAVFSLVYSIFWHIRQPWGCVPYSISFECAPYF